MKKYLASGCAFLFALSVQAQKPATPKKPAPKPVVSTIVLKTENDSLSYAIGMSVANFYRQQGISKLDANLVAKAIADVTANKKGLLSEDQVNLVLMCHSNPKLCENVQTGERFLVLNKKKANVKTTASGIQYEVLTQGTGERPGPTDTVTVNYKGTLLSGTEFDNSYTRGAPVTFPLTNVIKGWTESLQLMPVGSKYKLYIPYQAGYGLNDNGLIPGGSVLVFEVELLNMSKAK